MAVNSQKLNEGELSLYSKLISQGYVPVGVDLAARVFHVCYLTEKQKIKNKALSREVFLNFLNNPPFSQPLALAMRRCQNFTNCNLSFLLLFSFQTSSVRTSHGVLSSLFV